MADKWTPGRLCFHKTQDFKGIIRRSDARYVWVEDEAGFLEKFPKDQCVPDTWDLTGGVGAYTPVQKGDMKRKPAGNKSLVLDLHAEKLPAARGASPAQILPIQLAETQKFLERMRRQKPARFKIITGVGSGKLKREVERLLRRYGFDRYREEHFDGGAWIVEG
jgi:hypothetical protein